MAAEKPNNGATTAALDSNQISNKRTYVENLASSSEVTLIADGTEQMTNGNSLVLIFRENQALVPPLPPVYVSPRKQNKRPKRWEEHGGSL